MAASLILRRKWRRDQLERWRILCCPLSSTPRFFTLKADIALSLFESNEKINWRRSLGHGNLNRWPASAAAAALSLSLLEGQEAAVRSRRVLYRIPSSCCKYEVCGFTHWFCLLLSVRLSFLWTGSKLSSLIGFFLMMVEIFLKHFHVIYVGWPLRVI
ncbi:unnamed protein product [Victoria cruziana]